MAKKVMTLLVDDLDGTELGDKGVTVEFGWLGQPYEIDLSDENAETMKNALGLYVQHARRAAPTGRGRRRGVASSGGTNPDAKDARAWLIEHGHLSESHRGRISAENWERYRNRGQMSMEPATEPGTETAPRARTRNARSAAKASEGQQVPEAVSA